MSYCLAGVRSATLCAAIATIGQSCWRICSSSITNRKCYVIESWQKIIDKAALPPADIMPEPKGNMLAKNAAVEVAAMGAVVLISTAKRE